MERKDFLKAAGALGLSSLFHFNKAEAAVNDLAKTASLPGGACVLIPSETAGPFAFNLRDNAAMYRQDIREGHEGIPLNLTLTLLDINKNCLPIANARVDVWHCNKDGYYSEFANQRGYLGTKDHKGETFFRGIQLSNSKGQVSFTTIYPGWYMGRVTHIHFQVFLNSLLAATSQAAFPDSMNAKVYETPLYSPHGQNAIVNASDQVFRDKEHTQYEMLNITENPVSGGYDAALTIGLAVPASGIIHMEPETGGQFKIQSNYPNPFNTTTAIPFTLANASDVSIELFDRQGKKICTVIEQPMEAGPQKIILNKSSEHYTLPEGDYVYQVTVQNSNGTFRQCRLLTVN